MNEDRLMSYDDDDDGNIETSFIHFSSFDNEKKKRADHSTTISFRNVNQGGVERFVSFYRLR